MFRLYCASFPRIPQAWSVAETYQHLSAVLEELRAATHLPSALESRSLKEQFCLQLGELRQVPTPEQMSAASREALAAGCLCGALDGAWLFLEDEPPEPFNAQPASFSEELQQIVEVADLYWRGLDSENLELQRDYGREQNANTDAENVAALARGPGVEALQTLLRETFRTGYGIGMIEAALNCLTHQPG